jgi:hypothetical protein
MNYKIDKNKIFLNVNENEITNNCIQQIISEIGTDFSGTVYVQKNKRGYIYFLSYGYYKRKTDTGLKKGWFDINGILILNEEYKKISDLRKGL